LVNDQARVLDLIGQNAPLEKVVVLEELADFIPTPDRRLGRIDSARQ